MPGSTDFEALKKLFRENDCRKIVDTIEYLQSERGGGIFYFRMTVDPHRATEGPFTPEAASKLRTISIGHRGNGNQPGQTALEWFASLGESALKRGLINVQKAYLNELLEDFLKYVHEASRSSLESQEGISLKKMEFKHLISLTIIPK